MCLLYQLNHILVSQQDFQRLFFIPLFSALLNFYVSQIFSRLLYYHPSCMSYDPILITFFFPTFCSFVWISAVYHYLWASVPQVSLSFTCRTLFTSFVKMFLSSFSSLPPLLMELHLRYVKLKSSQQHPLCSHTPVSSLRVATWRLNTIHYIQLDYISNFTSLQQFQI